MKIAYQRSGGFAGLTRRVDVDTALLPPPERAEWEALLDEANFFSLPESIEPGSTKARDSFVHDIRVEADGRSHSVQVHGTSGDPPVKQLVARLQQATTGTQR